VLAAVEPPLVTTFADAEGLARTLLAAEEAIRSPDTPTGHLPGWAWAQQQAYRELVVHPEWRDQVRALIPEVLRPAFDANLVAGEQLRELTEPQQQLPPWRIVAPPPAEDLRRHYQAAEAEFEVGWEWLAAIHLVETRMGRIRGSSPAGAQGPMQFLPGTWEAYGEGDINDPGDAIRAAARYLVAHGAPGDMPGSLYAYNPSRRYVAAIEAYASVMRTDLRAYLGYYHWRVYYRLQGEDVLLEEGYEG
jgi:soluble lytic murein transglycosylase-like protein